MSTLTQTARNGMWLKWLVEHRFCLEVRVIEGGAAIGGSDGALYKGDVLRVGTGVKLIAVDATTGGDAMAVLLEDVTLLENTAGDVNRLCIVRGPAVLDSDRLVFTESATQKTQALAALAALDMLSINSALADWATQST